ncbi:hypothetical protein LJC58_03570 [Lachnospiraceae bacterium OttesenSCG-928-D06]|nr:hypothetical protein [Lachnospiraceae bacterium OttesenSCG-928-D06]
MRRLQKAAACILCSSMAITLSACGSSGNTGNQADESTSFTMWIYSGSDSSYYTDYKDNPVIQYALNKTFGEEEKTVDIEFWVPPAGSQTDSFSTMMTSGDYPDILDGSISASPKTMYEDGIILDLTDYVEQYMPNYYAYLEANQDVKSNAVIEVDGEQKILTIRGANDDYPYQFAGPQYRRDWIVKYGTNPVNGEKFSGGYTDSENPDSWEDDVVFPSGGTDPVYISDWEWMFEIFEMAQEDLGITDSYCTSVYYPGFTWNGGIASSFGGGVPVWYVNSDNQVQFGGDSEQFRAYLQCLNTWYEKEWLDSAFNERTSDIFYEIDSVSVRQGKVGLWVGIESQLGGRMDVGDEYTSGICSYGCAYPINDIYGTEECKNIIPDCLFNTSLTGTAYYITKAASEKDIPVICEFFDYFYSEEGALLRTMGLNKEQVEEIDNDFYKKWALEEGAYYIAEDGRYAYADVIAGDSGNLKDAVTATKIPGITMVKDVDRGYEVTYESSLKKWIQYENTAFFQGTAVTSNMSNEDAKLTDDIRNKILEYLTVNAADYIKGKKDPFSDSDWENWCTMLKKYNYQKASDIYQPYADAYSFK